MTLFFPLVTIKILINEYNNCRENCLADIGTETHFKLAVMRHFLTRALIFKTSVFYLGVRFMTQWHFHIIVVFDGHMQEQFGAEKLPKGGKQLDREGGGGGLNMSAFGTRI